MLFIVTTPNNFMFSLNASIGNPVTLNAFEPTILLAVHKMQGRANNLFLLSLVLQIIIYVA